MARERGELVYKFYRAVTHGLSPVMNLFVLWRKYRGLEHPQRWPERLGRPSLPRPAGPLVWFHAVSLGEGLSALPVIKCCANRRPDVIVLMTSTTMSALEVIKNRVPENVMYQFAPLDTPVAVEAFLGYWKPTAIVLMESELWPNLIMCAAKNGIVLALLNARISMKSFNRWSLPLAFHLISLLLSKFTLIAPLSNEQAIRFQLLEAPPFSINFSGDLKYVVDGSIISEEKMSSMKQLHDHISFRKVWMASSLHRGEERTMIEAHRILKKIHPDLLTIMVPRNPLHGQEIALELEKQGISIALRSRNEQILPGTSIYIVDTIGELRDLYRLTKIAVIGGSFLPGSAGHNISEAANAGCAILTGQYIGHFNHMARDMQHWDTLSVLQVPGDKLAETLIRLFSDAEILEAHCQASKEAYRALSNGVLERIWTTFQLFILDKAFPGRKL